MKIELTDEQCADLRGVLSTHKHNMATEASAAHGVNKQKEDFYLAAYARTEALIPLFSTPESAEDEEEEEEPE